MKLALKLSRIELARSESELIYLQERLQKVEEEKVCYPSGVPSLPTIGSPPTPPPIGSPPPTLLYR